MDDNKYNIGVLLIGMTVILLSAYFGLGVGIYAFIIMILCGKA